MKYSFSTFKEATQFVSNYCRENRCTANLVKEGDSWTVNIEATAQAESKNRTSSGWLPKAEWDKKINAERERRIKVEHEQIMRAEQHRIEKIIHDDRIAKNFANQTRAEANRAWPDRQRFAEKIHAKFSSKKDEIIELARAGVLSFEQLTLVLENHRLYDFSQVELQELNLLCQEKRSGPKLAACPKCYHLLANCVCNTVPL